MGTLRDIAASEEAAIRSTLASIASHPTRVECFIVLTERTASPKDLAAQLGKKLDHVSYHVRKLAEVGAIEVVDERQRRGATEHFYHAVERPVASDEEWAALPPGKRAQITRCILQLHVADLAVALEKGTFDSRPGRALIRFPMLVDEEGFAELNALHTELYERTLEVQAKSNARSGHDPDRARIPTMATWMFFECIPRGLPQDISAD